MEKEEERILMAGREIMERTKEMEKAVYPTRRKLARGMESAKGKNVKALTWKCPNCGKVNRPERRLLVVLPVIRCACGEESDVQFDFSLHKVEFNDHFLIPNIRKQNPKECSPCSMLALAEISWRVNAILNGQVLEDCEPYLDRADMLEKYNYLCDVCEIDKRFNQTAVDTLLEVFSTIGVQSGVPKEEDRDGSQTFKVNEKENPKVYRLPFYSAVKKDFSAICRLLGDGYVIRTSFYAGKDFGKLKPGKIYKSPGRGRVRHAIVLIGAGRRGTTNYYHFLNSWGKKFCLRFLKRGIRVGRTRFWSSRRGRNTEKALGGFGLLRESDIRAQPVTFLRHGDDHTYYKRLLMKDIVPLGKIKERDEAASIIPSWEAPQIKGSSVSVTCRHPKPYDMRGGTIPIPAYVCWPPSSVLSTDDTARALMRHGLDPWTLDGYQDMVLDFIYGFLPKPSVSVAATLSCAAAEEGEGVDRISGLPDDLLRRVLACLPAKDGARTAVLSTRWRGLWSSTPLVLVDTHFLHRGGAEGRPPCPGVVSRAVHRAVLGALRTHPGPFPFISLSCQFIQALDVDRAMLARWFQLLATKGVEELAFVNRPSPLVDLRIPAALFSCASLRHLYLGAWRFVDTANLPHGVSFPNLQELVLGAVALDNHDIDFLLSASPVLEILGFIGSVKDMRVCLASHSLRCVQFCLSFVEEVSVVDAPCLERLFFWRCPSSSVRVKIGHAPQLTMLGYLEPGAHILEIGNTVIKSRTKPSPKTTVPSVQMLALVLQFRIYNEVKMLPSFLRCFPNVETLCIQSEKTDEPTSCLNVKFWEEAGPIRCIQSHLKRLMFREFHGDDNEFAFLMYIAENAKVLETMFLVMGPRRRSKPEELAELAARLKALDNARWACGSSKLGYMISRLGEEGSVWNFTMASDFMCNDPFFCGV